MAWLPHEGQRNRNQKTEAKACSSTARQTGLITQTLKVRGAEADSAAYLSSCPALGLPLQASSSASSAAGGGGRCRWGRRWAGWWASAEFHAPVQPESLGCMRGSLGAAEALMGSRPCEKLAELMLRIGAGLG